MDQIQITREAAIAELWHRGDLSWKLRPEQRVLKAELERPNIQLGVFNISRRWGKTYTLVSYCLEQAMRRKQRIRYGCAFLNDLEEFVLPAFEQILEDCPEHLRPTYVRSRKTWKFPNGSEIKLVGLDKNPNGLRGNALSIIVIDEAGFVSNLKYIYTSVIIPATAKQKGIKIVFISTPPESPEHYFTELITKAQTQANGYYLCLTIDDISDLDPAERQRLLDEVGGEESTTAQREFFCRIVIEANRAICAEFDEKKHTRTFEVPQYCFMWTSGDYGGSRDKTVFHLNAYNFDTNEHLVVDERAFESNTSTPVIMAEVLAMEAPYRSKITHRWVDAPGQVQVDMASLFNYETAIPRKTEDMEAGVKAVRVAFTRAKLVVHTRCTFTITSLKLGMWNKQRTDFERTESLGHLDGIASLVYGHRHKNIDNPYPKNFGFRQDQMVRQVSPDESHALKSLIPG